MKERGRARLEGAAYASFRRCARIGATVRPLLPEKVTQALVVLATGRAALEVRPHARDLLVRPPALELELDVPSSFSKHSSQSNSGSTGPSNRFTVS